MTGGGGARSKFRQKLRNQAESIYAVRTNGDKGGVKNRVFEGRGKE